MRGGLRLLAKLVIAALALMFVACGTSPPAPSPPVPSATEPPDFIRSIVGENGTVRRLLVYDPAGLLEDIQAPIQHTDQRGNIWWDPMAGDPNSLVIGWLGGVCGVDPTLNVERSDSSVSLAIFDGRIPPSSDVCPAMATTYGLRLTFHEAISNLEVSVALSEEPQ
jgi:hypothetical protein